MKETPFPLSTYAKILLSSWPPIFNIITKYTRVKKQRIRTDLPLLSEEQMEEVFIDKQNTFIQYAIATWARALLAYITLDQQLEMLEKQKTKTVHAILTLEAYFKEDQTDPQLVEALETARDTLSDIKNTQTMLEKRQGFFDQVQGKMENLLHTQDAQWETFRDTWSSLMIEALEKTGIQLTTLEKTEIKRQKTMAELIERMKELGLSLPKDLSHL